jgi:hypothetical protein
MRLVTINLSCDWANCDTVAPENEGLVTEMTLAVDGKQAKTFSICKPHRDELEENLHTLLARGVGETKKTPAKRSSSAAAGNDSGTSAVATVPVGVTISCRVPVGVARCGQRCQGNVGLAQHLKKKHDMTIAEHDALPTG